MMVPFQVTIIPIFILLRNLHLVDTHSGLIFPALVHVFGIFLLRQFFATIPAEYEDSAKMDGAGYFIIFTRIILPLGKAGLSTLAIFTFNHYWNEYFRPLILLSDIKKMTIPLGLVFLRGEYGVGSASIVLAGVTVAVLPILIIFLFAQKYLVEGITFTGIKG